MRALMIQGAGSNVGKSLLVAGLCRAARLRGLRVLPFKPQNMSNNAAVTANGGEIGRAQALQALACGVPAHTDMNPVLLKPESERGAQVIVQGHRLASVMARDYAGLKPQLMTPVLDSFARLKSRADLVIVEGAGSPAEVNLRAGDIANMGFARAADVPVVLVGDIDRGGVIAQIIGTQAVLDPADAAMISGFIINKFRGDASLFDDGYRLISARTGWRGYGLVPYFDAATRLPAEDAQDLPKGVSGNGGLTIACLALPRIANFDDLDPLRLEPGVRLVMVAPGEAVPGTAALVIVPGTKSTRGDLAFLRAQGWDVDLAAHLRRGGRVLGLCGGYQMLGRVIRDPDGLEGPAGETAGLGHLDVDTVMRPEKRLAVTGAYHVATGMPITGYEIHIGHTLGPDRARPFAFHSDKGEAKGAGWAGAGIRPGVGASDRSATGGGSDPGQDWGGQDWEGSDGAQRTERTEGAEGAERKERTEGTERIEGAERTERTVGKERTEGAEGTEAAAGTEGAVSSSGLVMGTYLHGLFAEDAFRRAFIAMIGGQAGAGPDVPAGVASGRGARMAFQPPVYRADIEDVLDALAAHLERHLDVDGLLALAR